MPTLELDQGGGVSVRQSVHQDGIGDDWRLRL
jgi:hypothetical protein